MKKAYILLSSLVVVSLFAGGDKIPAASGPQAPPPTNEVVEAKVVKVYSAKDGDAEFRAYVVRWKDQEVVVSDPLVITNYKEGDVHKFLAMKLPNPKVGKKPELLAFTVVPYK